MYNNKDMEGMVERVLGYIAWLLDEVQRPDSVHDVVKSLIGQRVILQKSRIRFLGIDS